MGGPSLNNNVVVLPDNQLLLMCPAVCGATPGVCGYFSVAISRGPTEESCFGGKAGVYENAALTVVLRIHQQVGNFCEILVYTKTRLLLCFLYTPAGLDSSVRAPSADREIGVFARCSSASRSRLHFFLQRALLVIQGAARLSRA